MQGRAWMIVLVLLLGISGCKGLVAVDENNETQTQIDLRQTRQDLILSPDERTLYVNVGNLGLDIFDVTTPSAVKLLKNYRAEDHTYALAMSGNTLFLANGTEGVELLDISHPEVLQRIAYIRTGDDNATSVALSADTQTVAIGTGAGVQLFDISRQRFPAYLGRYESNGTVMDLQFNRGGELYLANSAYGFESVDISTPSRPRLLGGVALEGSAIALGSDALQKDLYIATLTSALKKIDLTDPRNPEYAIYYDAHDAGVIWDFGFGVDDRRLYLARDREGLEIVSVETTGGVRRLSSFDTNGTARGVTLNRAETVAYVADGNEGLKVIDISDKLHPKRIGYLKF